MTYEAEFVGGHVSPVTVCGEYPRSICGQRETVLIGVATRDDGKARCVFFTRDGDAKPDPWLTAIRTA